MGFCPRNEKLLRSEARVGDKICVSGCLGDAAFGLAVMQGQYRGLELDFDDQEYLVGRFTHPTARLDLGRQLRQRATSCIDLSDGLLRMRRMWPTPAAFALVFTLPPFRCRQRWCRCG